MKYPNKLISYDNSTIKKIELSYKEINKCDCTPIELYDKLKNHFDHINEFVEVLDCLFLLDKIILSEEGRIVKC